MEKLQSVTETFYKSFDSYLKFILPKEIYSDLKIVSSLNHFRVSSNSGIFYPAFFKCTIFSSDFVFLGVVYDENCGCCALFSPKGFLL